MADLIASALDLDSCWWAGGAGMTQLELTVLGWFAEWFGFGVLERAVSAYRAFGLRPLVVCANAGTTNTGAVDLLHGLADLCAVHGLWLHVDAVRRADSMRQCSDEESSTWPQSSGLPAAVC
jgi:hypothetical protein